MRGVKEVVLFPPADMRHLGYRARPKGQLKYAWPSNFTRTPIDAGGAAARVIFAASVNLSSPSAAEAAALGRCAPLVCTLLPGETLLLPAYWHHEVHSCASTADAAEAEAGAAEGGATEGGLNLAVNFWFRNETAPPPSFA